MAPYEATPFEELWRARIATSAPSPFVVTHERTWSYGQFDQVVEAQVRRLRRLGVRDGEGIAIQGPNTAERLALHFAAQMCHLVTVPLLEGLTEAECARVVEHSAPSWVVSTRNGTAGGTGELLEETADERVLDRRMILTDDDRAEARRIGERDAGWIIYTSGSSGAPKGVVLPRASFASCGLGYSQTFMVTGDDRLLMCFPMGHAIGTHTIPAVAVVTGASIALVERFSVSRFWTDVETLGATVSVLFPSQLTLLSDVATPISDTPLRQIITHEVHSAFATRFPSVRLSTVWGMTETGVIGTGLCSDQVDRPNNLVGRAMPVEHAEVAVIGADGRPRQFGEPGEIAFRNPVGQMVEYFREPELTDLTLVDGWVRSGDLGEMSPDGLVFLGRLKNIIKRAGETIVADEIEHVLDSHPQVLECSVCAVPDRDYTEEVGVVVTATSNATAEDLLAWLRPQLATWKLPRYWLLMEETLPRLENHKIARQQIITLLTTDPSTLDLGNRRPSSAVGGAL